MREELIHAVYETVDELKSSPEYKRLLKLHNSLDSDEIKDKITSFEAAKTKYEEVSKYGKHHPDLSRVSKMFQKAKTELLTDPIVAEYKQLERHLDTVLRSLSKEIALSISPKLKYPNELGIIPKH